MCQTIKPAIRGTKRLFFFLSTIIIAVLFSQCKKDPVKGWDFYYEPPPPPIIKSINSVVRDCVPPYPVTFYQETENLLGNVTYEWDFGDGKYSTDKNPNNIFTTPGEYTIRLIVSNEIGADTAYIEMPQLAQESIPVVADFTYTHFNNNNYAPNKVLFENNSSGANLFYWHHGDGNQTDNVNPEHVYQEEGTYTVTLRGICSNETYNETTRQVFVLPAPQWVFIDSLNLMMPSAFKNSSIFIELWHNTTLAGYTRIFSTSSFPVKLRRPQDFPGGYFFDFVQFTGNEVFEFVIMKDNGEEPPSFINKIVLASGDIQNKFYPNTYFQVETVPKIDNLFIDIYISY